MVDTPVDSYGVAGYQKGDDEVGSALSVWVLAKNGAIGYLPNDTARKLAVRRPGAVGLAIRALSNAIFAIATKHLS